MSMLVLPPRQTNRMGSAYFDGDRAVILSATKPTVRAAEVGGGALVAGDIWVDTATGERWLWNGTVFVETVERRANAEAVNISSGNSFYSQKPDSFLEPGIGTSLLLTRAWARLFVTTTNNASNFWTIQLCYRVSAHVAIYNSGAITNIGSTFSTAAGAADTNITNTWTLNTVINTTGVECFGFALTKTLSPGNIGVTAHLYYRRIAP